MEIIHFASRMLWLDFRLHVSPSLWKKKKTSNLPVAQAKNLGVTLSSLCSVSPLLSRSALVDHLQNTSSLWLPIGPSRHRRSPGLLYEPLMGPHGSSLSLLSHGLFLLFFFFFDRDTQNNPTKTLGQTKSLLCLVPPRLLTSSRVRD